MPKRRGRNRLGRGPGSKRIRAEDRDFNLGNPLGQRAAPDPRVDLEVLKRDDPPLVVLVHRLRTYYLRLLSDGTTQNIESRRRLDELILRVSTELTKPQPPSLERPTIPTTPDWRTIQFSEERDGEAFNKLLELEKTLDKRRLDQHIVQQRPGALKTENQKASLPEINALREEIKRLQWRVKRMRRIA
jgi:hypothetical protein